jgi:hypothetical protein
MVLAILVLKINLNLLKEYRKVRRRITQAVEKVWFVRAWIHPAGFKQKSEVDPA